MGLGRRVCPDGSNVLATFKHRKANLVNITKLAAPAMSICLPPKARIANFSPTGDTVSQEQRLSPGDGEDCQPGLSFPTQQADQVTPPPELTDEQKNLAVCQPGL